MKNLLFLLMAVMILAVFPSCDILKQSVSTSAELYIGELKGQPVKYIDKKGYLQHFIEMKATGFWAEHIKGTDFVPVKDFYGEIPFTNSTYPANQVIETSDGRKLYWIFLFSPSGEQLIKPYSRVLH